MPFNNQELEKINLAWQGFLMKNRPAPEIRHKLDFGMSIDGQSIEIYEIRPRWDLPEVSLKSPIAKTTYIRTKSLWKIFWMRSNLKWYPYDPKPTVKSFEDFLKEVDNDTHHCFWG